MTPDPDELIRRVLDAEAAKVDAVRLWAGVQQRLAADAPTPSVRSRRCGLRYAAALVVLAAVVMFGFVLWPMQQVAASPAELVAAVQADLEMPRDRSYAFTLDVPPDAAAKYPVLAKLAKPRTLTVRGRRFTLSPGFAETGWFGRDDRDRLWLVASPQAAARFELDELPPRLRELFETLDLELPTLLGEVLRDFDLTESPAEAGRRNIVAVKRNALLGRPGRVEMTIDDRRELQALTWTRTIFAGTIVLRLRSLDEPKPTQTADPAYAMEPGAVVHDRERPLQRRRLVVAQLGEAIFQGN